MNQRKPGPFEDQAEQHLQEEAQRIARSTQVQGQTKEQTKLIAKGIEKGIALYKQQQKAKARERDKARKKILRLKARAEEVLQNDEPPLADSERGTSTAKPALIVSSALFAMGALIHVVRYFLGWELTVGSHPIPVLWSLPIALFAAGLAAWMFRSART